MITFFKDKIDILRMQDNATTDVLHEDILKELKDEVENKEQDDNFELKRLAELENKLQLSKNHLQTVFQSFYPDATAAEAQEFAMLIADVLFSYIS